MVPSLFKQVLYKFLEYFSKFDWDKYCISLNGPVPLSSLPNLTGESYSGILLLCQVIAKHVLTGLIIIIPVTVEPSGIHDELLFGPNGSCDRLIVLKKDSDGSNMNFRPKYLNIIDPIKSSNNLGRSVSKGQNNLEATSFYLSLFCALFSFLYSTTTFLYVCLLM